jgi:hypothetical protein
MTATVLSIQTADFEIMCAVLMLPARHPDATSLMPGSLSAAPSHKQRAGRAAL